MRLLPISRTGLAALTLCVLSGAAHADPAHGSGPLADTHAPAGVMFEHMHKAGEIMLGYRYAYTRASGDTVHGTHAVNDRQIMDRGCTPHRCSMKASEMIMQMHMLDIMYAPTDWMTLMVMPMWMSHDMTMKPLNVAAQGGQNGHHDSGAHAGHGGGHAGAHTHGVEGWGDTIFGPELRLTHGPNYHLQFSPMFSAPTGAVDKRPGGRFTHYGMQIGSGTWDFWPSLTYTGRADRLAWGAQVLGIIRMEEENKSGYRLGDVLQVTGWGSYRFANWISASLRVLYTEQGEIEGHYNGPHNHTSPADLQFNYGGRFWDLGFGINTVVPSGPLKGLRLSAEWLQPIEDDFNGYQLERDGTLWANATIGF
ncbi:MAG: transporter [Methyloceanibacter sp.]